MHTKIKPENPYGYDRYGFAWQHVPDDGAAHLDFGCGDARFLAGLSSKHIKDLVGVDVSEGATRQASDIPCELKIVHIDQTIPLPFADETFSSITLMDVLEHVDEQEPLLAELYRVLRPGGTLIVTVPREHLLSFLDLGNLKFVLPGLHRWYYCLRHTAEEYEARYVANPNGLIGDVSAKKHWHEHFSLAKLERLLNHKSLSVVEIDGTGLLFRLLKIAEVTLGRIVPVKSLIRRLMVWDARRFASANLFCVAKKQDAQERS
jgi:SAM-dependent methyltransferase